MSKDLDQIKNRLMIFVCWLLIISFFILVLYSIRNIFLIFSFAFLFSYLLKNPVNLINRYIKYKPISLLVFVLFCLLMISLFSIFLYPLVSEQINDFIQESPRLRESAVEFLHNLGVSYISEQDLESPQNIQKFIINNFKSLNTSSLFGFFGNSLQATITVITVAVIVLIATIFMVVDSEKIWQAFLSLFPKKYAIRVNKIGTQINHNLEAMVLGQFKIAVITSLVMLITYISVGSKFAILLGLLQMLEVIPIVGTWMGFLPGFVIILLTLSFEKSLIVLFVYLIFSQIIRDHFIAPKIYGNAFGVHPLGMIFGFLIGIKIFGILGILGVLPIIAFLNSLYLYYSQEEH